MEKSIFEQIGGTYHREGDYFLPNLTVPANAPVGIWGQRRRQYLREHRKALYNTLLLSGKLNSHLAGINQQANDMFSQLVEQMAEQEGITEQLKADSQMEWAGRMNNIRSAVEEIVNTEELSKTEKNWIATELIRSHPELIDYYIKYKEDNEEKAKMRHWLSLNWHPIQS